MLSSQHSHLKAVALFMKRFLTVIRIRPSLLHRYHFCSTTQKIALSWVSPELEMFGEFLQHVFPRLERRASIVFLAKGV